MVNIITTVVYIERLKDGNINIYRRATKRERKETGSPYMIFDNGSWISSTIRDKDIESLVRVPVKSEQYTWEDIPWKVKKGNPRYLLDPNGREVLTVNVGYNDRQQILLEDLAEHLVKVHNEFPSLVRLKKRCCRDIKFLLRAAELCGKFEIDRTKNTLKSLLQDLE